MYFRPRCDAPLAKGLLPAVMQNWPILMDDGFCAAGGHFQCPEAERLSDLKTPSQKGISGVDTPLAAICSLAR